MEEKPQWKAVRINETHLYQVREEDKKYIATIGGVYIYDNTVQWYCCSSTPCFWLIPVHTTLEFVEGVEITEEMHDRLYDRYGYEPMDPYYVHVSAIEKLSSQEVPAGNYDPAEAMEVVEYLQGNWLY
jgi:hypothetical protein